MKILRFTLYLKLTFADTFAWWPTALALPLGPSVFAPDAAPASFLFYFLSPYNLEERGPVNYYYILRCSSGDCRPE